jgi:hypothetical protein
VARAVVVAEPSAASEHEVVSVPAVMTHAVVVNVPPWPVVGGADESDPRTPSDRTVGTEVVAVLEGADGGARMSGEVAGMADAEPCLQPADGQAVRADAQRATRRPGMQAAAGPAARGMRRRVATPGGPVRGAVGGRRLLRRRHRAGSRGRGDRPGQGALGGGADRRHGRGRSHRGDVRGRTGVQNDGRGGGHATESGDGETDPHQSGAGRPEETVSRRHRWLKVGRDVRFFRALTEGEGVVVRVSSVVRTGGPRPDGGGPRPAYPRLHSRGQSANNGSSTRDRRVTDRDDEVSNRGTGCRHRPSRASYSDPEV